MAHFRRSWSGNSSADPVPDAQVCQVGLSALTEAVLILEGLATALETRPAGPGTPAEPIAAAAASRICHAPVWR